jgi:hypothetical protein
MEGQDFLKIFFQHSTTSLNDVPSRKGGNFGTPCIKCLAGARQGCLLGQKFFRQYVNDYILNDWTNGFTLK